VAYPTVEELVAASSVEEFLSMEDADKAALRIAAISGIESFCNQSFALTEDLDVLLDGAGGSVVFLPRRIETLAAVELDGTALTLSDVVIGAERDRLTLKRTGSTYYERALRAVQDVPDSPRWPSGTDSVKLTGDFGWATCPENVATAIRYECEDTARADANDLATTVAAYRKLGLTAISQGNLSATLGQPVLLTPRAERLLLDYRWIGEAGVLI
jgi:hypothetical protein